MLNRRTFFSLIAGALGSLALPRKAAAERPQLDVFTATGEYRGTVYAGVDWGFGSDATAVTWVTLDEHYSRDGKHLLTLFTLEGADRPFWVEYEDRTARAPNLGSIPCVRSTYEKSLDVVLARYPHVIKGLPWISRYEEVSIEELRRRYPESRSLARMGVVS